MTYCNNAQKTYFCREGLEQFCIFFKVLLNKADLDYSLKAVNGNDQVQKVEFDKSRISIFSSSLCTSFPHVWDLRLWFMELELIQPEAFEKCTDLKILNLHENNLVHLAEDTFKAQHMLENVVISNNQLQWISTKHFAGSADTLRELVLYSNKLKIFIVDTETTMLALQTINLRDNQIISLDVDAIKKRLYVVKIIDATQNPIWCMQSLHKSIIRDTSCYNSTDFPSLMINRTNEMVIGSNKQIGTLGGLLNVLQLNLSATRESIFGQTKNLFVLFYTILGIIIVLICIFTVVVFAVWFYLNRKIVYLRPEATYYQSYGYSEPQLEERYDLNKQMTTAAQNNST